MFTFCTRDFILAIRIKNIYLSITPNKNLIKNKDVSFYEALAHKLLS